MSNAKLTQFAGHLYLNLETYRKNGQAVATPVWFVQEQDTFYVRTVADSGKIKRIRNNPRVRVMPCGMRGEPEGEWVEGYAREADAAQAGHARKLFDKKYGLRKKLFELVNRLDESKMTIIVIQIRADGT